jgi:vanillate/4-hydroxybenzoate decarboxylase subunit D
MICPRCDSDNAALLVKAPVDDAWEIYICGTCNFSWRSTESEDITDPAKYDPRFKIDPKEIPNLSVLPPIPKLAK